MRKPIKKKICPVCKEILSIDTEGDYYCHACGYTQPAPYTY